MKTKAKLIASLKIWVAIYPSITLFLFLFGQQLSPLPLYLRTLILTVVLVPWLIFVAIPLIESGLSRISTKK